MSPIVNPNNRGASDDRSVSKTSSQSSAYSSLLPWGGSRRPVVVVLPLRGVISSSSGGLHFSALWASMEKAFKTKGVREVVLLINSPGGSPVQSSQIGDALCYLKNRYQIPITAIVEDVAASGGYWLACAADRIVVNASSVVGSIGVVSAGFGFAGLIERWNVERRVHSVGKNKVQLDPFAPLVKDDVAHVKKTMGHIQENFVEWVKSRRADKLSDDENIFSGQYWIGKQAVEMGLADEINNFPQWVDGHYGAKAKVVWIKPKSSFSFWKYARSSNDSQLLSLLRPNDILHAVDHEILWQRFRLY